MNATDNNSKMGNLFDEYLKTVKVFLFILCYFCLKKRFEHLSDSL